MKIVMDERAIESFMNHCLIEAGTEYAESIGDQFHKVFLDPIKPVEPKMPYVFDVKLTLNGIDVDPASFFKLIEDDMDRQVRIAARKMLSRAFGEVEYNLVKQLDIEVDNDRY